MKIRRMQKEDLAEAARIEQICFRENWSARLLRESFLCSWNIMLGAEEEGRLIGYGAASVIAGEGEIQRLAVLPEFRGKGRGRKLLDELVNHAKEQGAKVLALEVRESNLPARKLYISAGFLEEARRKDYYRNPKEDAVIMWKRAL